MGDVLANLEDQINNAKSALAPLVQAEASALAAAATSTAARVKQDVQVAALTAAHLAAKAEMFGSNVVSKVESEASTGWQKIIHWSGWAVAGTTVGGGLVWAGVHLAPLL